MTASVSALPHQGQSDTQQQNDIQASQTESTNESQLVVAPEVSAAATPTPAPARQHTNIGGVPSSVLHDALLNASIASSGLPTNYNFEVHKCVWRIRSARAKCVALQLPEGLQMYACILSDLLLEHAKCEQTLIMGEVTYGACCVDDLTAQALGCDFLIHFGHSCLVPTQTTRIQCLYVFVDIFVDTSHLIATIRHTMPVAEHKKTHLYLAGTIQFSAALQHAAAELSADYPLLTVPACRPLSHGEVLGCTAPKLLTSEQHPSTPIDCVIFVSDGRFHLESLMIQNPHIRKFLKYDPYSQRLTHETYAHSEMAQHRERAIQIAIQDLKQPASSKWGLILGTLGRQGNPNLLRRLIETLKQRNVEHVVVGLSEIFPDKLELLSDVTVWVQVACPRLSIDWGHAFKRPMLNTYEADCALGKTEFMPVQQNTQQRVYPQDYYAESGGDWSNYALQRKQRAEEKQKAASAPILRDANGKKLLPHQIARLRAKQQAEQQQTPSIEYELQ